ncbi:hypothetical protein N7G274_008668 [Stereocaulon virgatum]|uniref:ATP synthase mitochondrial F1 complex assembly factor 2 n=1 Tax=Stereocaulon virgatum TaxID=373712 RepID=A0ABR3ZZI3_9LECA
MQRIVSLSSSPLFCTSHRSIPSHPQRSVYQCLHTTAHRTATHFPISVPGPPPPAPSPAVSQYGERVDRRRKQAELLKKGQDLRASHMKPGTAMKKRFWKDVSGQTDNENNHTIHLDNRAVRNPTTKTPLLIPPSKPHLASALALEWDLLLSAQQATKSHLIPITSISSRAHTLSLEDAKNPHSASSGQGIRYDIINMLLRYLDTDTLLCWAPASRNYEGKEESGGKEGLRELQIRIAKPILSYLTQRIWPGMELTPTLDDGSILPKAQPPATRAIIKGWMAGLPAWELVGLERAVLAGKSLCVGARLVCEWSEYLRLDTDASKEQVHDAGRERFGIEEAAEACSLEVRWQTGRWGEVEDTHDVEKEDLRRQFGSVVLIVSGTGKNA